MRILSLAVAVFIAGAGGLTRVHSATLASNTVELCANASGNVPKEQQSAACTEISASKTFDASLRAKAFIQLGRIHTGTSQYSLAISEFDQAIKLNSSDPHAFGGRAMALSMTGKNHEALQDFNEAIRLAPRADLFAVRAAFKFGMNDFKGANADIKQAIKLDPGLLESPGWRQKIDEILKQDGRAADIELTNRCANAQGTYTYDERVEACTKISRSEDIDSFIRGSAYGLLGHMYLQNFQPNKAIDEFTEAVRLNPDADSYGGRASAFAMLGQNKDAIADFDEALRLEPYAKTFLLRGAVKFKIDDLAGAKTDAETALALDPTLGENPQYEPMLKQILGKT